MQTYEIEPKIPVSDGKNSRDFRELGRRNKLVLMIGLVILLGAAFFAFLKISEVLKKAEMERKTAKIMELIKVDRSFTAAEKSFVREAVEGGGGNGLDMSREEDIKLMEAYNRKN